ncbi:MAG: phospholipase D-like domain-containing protein [Candidatus Omnitrophota bacterium]|jgi:HKD family nuclease
MRRYLLIILITLFAFSFAPVFAGERSDILIGKDYFLTTLQAIQKAQKSIYVAIYLISVEPAPTDNPASILLEGLISAKNRGVYVKVILDDTTFKVNYNAYKRLRQAGVNAAIDSSKAVLHGKGLVIDSKICILGSFNWTRASLRDNYEFAVYTESPRQAGKLLDYISKIELSLNPPIQPQQLPGLKLPVSLLTSAPNPLLFELFTSHSEKAFDLYLYLAKKAQSEHSSVIKINYPEFGQALGYTNNYYFNLFQPLRKLTRKYGLIQHKPWSKNLELIYTSFTENITIPDTYWDYGFCQKLSFAAKYMFLVSLSEAQRSSHNPYWFRSNADLSRIYYISERSITSAITELEKENILEVYRHRPEKEGEFDKRPANDYRLNPLQSPEQFRQALQALSDKYTPDLTQQACQLSAQLNEPKDLEKIETYLGLIQTYGYEKVREVNSKVASYRPESALRNLSQVILLLKNSPR